VGYAKGGKKARNRGVAMRFERGAGVQDEGRAAGESGDALVMHHPRCRGEVEHARSRGEGAVQEMLLLVLE
jgi:hypothetical protein